MRSSISSSRILATLFGVVLFGGALGLHESMVRRNYLVGGFVTLIDWKEVAASGVFPGADRADIAIFGSSRAKESIRPAILAEAEAAPARVVVNRACHSCSSLVQVRNLAAAIAAGSREFPKAIVVTVEPLHFMSRYIAADRDRPTGESDGENWPMREIAAIRTANERFLESVNDRIAGPLYETLVSVSPTQRRPFSLWGRFAGAAARATIMGRAAEVPYLYDFYIASRGNRFFTLLTEIDAGFEGHTLKLAAADATRDEAFEHHRGIYRDYILPDYRPDMIDGFSTDLSVLRQAGIRVALVRLPIHTLLYELEASRAPDFDTRMTAAADRAGVPYLALQVQMYDFANDRMAFTDGSHFESAATFDFTRRLRTLIEPFVAPQ